MNTGIVMIGFALVLLSLGLMVTPTAATAPDIPCSPGCGCTIIFQEIHAPGEVAGTGVNAEDFSMPASAATIQLP
ncbi:MAG: hypothetical protein WCX22_10500 [Methanoregula sp.]